MQSHDVGSLQLPERTPAAAMNWQDQKGRLWESGTVAAQWQVPESDPTTKHTVACTLVSVLPQQLPEEERKASKFLKLERESLVPDLVHRI